MVELTMTIQLTLQGPILTASSATGGYSVDAVMARNQAGHPMLAYSLVQGRLRESLMELTEHAADLDQSHIFDWLGPDVIKGAGEDDLDAHRTRRAPIIVSDFICGDGAGVTRNHANNQAVRIQMDHERGSVKTGALQVLESSFAPGEKVTFTGEITLPLYDADQASHIVTWMCRGMAWIKNFGALRNIGFGKLIGVKVLGTRTVGIASDETKAISQCVYQCLNEIDQRSANNRIDQTAYIEVEDTSASVSDEIAGMLELEIEVRDPFCIPRLRPGDNQFISETIINGRVMKGAMARAINNLRGAPPAAPILEEDRSPWATLLRHYGEIRFLPAFPTRPNNTGRPIVTPFSIVHVTRLSKDEPNQWVDVALTDGPILLEPDHLAPTFSTDWKVGQAPDWFGWAAPQSRELRVRTAIDPCYRRSRDEHLFAYEMIRPEGMVWRGRIDFNRVDRALWATLKQQFNAICEKSTMYIGKSRARAKYSVLESGPSNVNCTSSLTHIGDDHLWVITLQSPMLMLSPEQNATSRKELQRAYQEYFDSVSSHWDLIRYFAKQRLAGGYIGRRYMGRHGVYYPFLLTEEGSVFVLRAKAGAEARAQQYIAAWHAEGLPLPPWATEDYGAGFEDIPFRPQEGYGEIAVNLPCHTEHAVKKGTRP